jgi:Phosphodiester glycosidase/FlgD Ig-like domain
VRTRVLLLAVLAVVLGAPASGLAQPIELMPGVTYERRVQTIAGQPVVVHVVMAPKPGGLYAVAPILSNGEVVGRDTLTGMERDVGKTATVVGVNGDLFNYDTDSSTGMLMRGGTLVSRPYSSRSSLGIGLDGLLRIGRVGFFGKWTIGAEPRQTLDQLNRPLNGKGVALFTPAYGPATPEVKNAVDVVLAGLPQATVNTDLAAQVVSLSQGGATQIPPDGAVLQVVGAASTGLDTIALPGAPFVVRLALKPWWDGVPDALGGGPALVQDGKIVVPTSEDFSSTQIVPRAPRTAVGQLADGRIVLVAADGRRSWTAGVDTKQLADLMVSFGAVNAIAMDSGGSTTLAFDGELLNSPSAGAERSISNALMVMYYGVYAAPPSEPVVSPNGDGVAETENLAYKVVRPSTVSARLLDPGGKAIWKDEGAKDPGTYELVPEAPQLGQGTWRWVVSAVDADGNESKSERTFSVNSSIGFLELSKRALKVTKKRGGALGISFKVAKKSRLLVTVNDSAGTPVRTLLSHWQSPTDVRVTWDGRSSSGQTVAAGLYAVEVEARNRLGTVDLTAPVIVRRGK